MYESKLNDIQQFEPGKASIPADEYGEQALLARIPLQSRDSRKASYLSWRAVGFAIRESCDLTGVSEHTLRMWRRQDAEFAEFESIKLPDLQRSAGKDILKIEFQRNMRLALFRDFQVLFKAAYDLEALSEKEMGYLRLIRRLYTPQDLAVLDKALEPDQDGKGNVQVNTIVINVDGKTVEDESARRAAARQLLAQFAVNKRLAAGPAEPIVEQVVEGELVSHNGDSPSGNGDSPN